MKNKVTKFGALSKGARAFFIQSLFWVPLFHFLLRIGSYSRLYEWLSTHSYLCISDYNIHLDHLGNLSRTAARQFWFDRTCLARSLFLWWWLKQCDLDGEIMIGFSKDNASDAHAWVELDGKIINDQPNMREIYSVLRKVGRRI